MASNGRQNRKKFPATSLTNNTREKQTREAGEVSRKVRIEVSQKRS